MAVKPPYTLYKSQIEYITDGVNFLKDDTNDYLLQEGPTGMGKTICNLMEALKWIETANNRVVYFSREHEQIQQCITDLSMLLRINDQDVKAVHIGGRSMACLRPEVLELTDNDEQLITCEELHSTMCDYSDIRAKMEQRPPAERHIYTLRSAYRGIYYNFDVQAGDTAIQSVTIDEHLQETSIDDLVDEMFETGIATNDVIMQIAEKYIICPRKLQHLAMTQANIIFAPYNYLVIPRIPYRDDDKILFIIDEAHNLDQNLTSMMSFKIHFNTFKRFLEEVSEKYRSETEFVTATEEVINQINVIIRSDRDLIGEELKRELKNISRDKFEIMYSFINLYARRGVRRRTIYRQEAEAGDERMAVAKAMLSMQKFCEALDMLLKNHTAGLIKIEKEYIYTRFVDVNKIFKVATNKAHKVIISSGTLYPKYMAKYLGVPTDKTITKTYKPPHTKLVGTGQIIASVDGTTLNTKYSERGMQKFLAISKVIKEVAERNNHGTLVYFPSYSYMKSVGEFMNGEYGLTYYTADRVSEYKRHVASGGDAIFMTAFRGKGSEGWNFADDLSRAIILCGTPYMPLDIMVKAQMQYYDSLHNKLGQTWYKQKAVLWLMQAFGRGIRHKDDWTKVYLLDNKVQHLRQHFAKWVAKAINWRPREWSGKYGR